MPDYSKMSNEELLALKRKQSAPASPEPTWGETGEDVAKTIPSGLARGVAGLAGLPADAGAALNNYVVDPLMRKMGLDPGGKKEAGLGAENIQKGIEGVTGELYQPQTRTGKFVNSVAEMAPNAVAGPGGVGRRLLTQAVLPGVASEGAGQLTEGSAVEPVARAAGALVAPLAAQRAVTPMRTPQGRARMVENLEQEGVTNATAGQKTGSKALQYLESQAGDAYGAGNSASNAQRLANEQFTRAALTRAGAPRDIPLTRAALDKQVQNVQDTYNVLAARHSVRFDPTFATDLRTVLNRYNKKLDSLQKPLVTDILTDIAQFRGSMPGDVYQMLRSDLSGMASSVTRDAPYSKALRGIRSALDEAMARSIPAGHPDKGAWKANNKRYEAWKTLGKAAKSLDDEGNILITPAGLKSAASAGKKTDQYVRGNNMFTQLADSGARILRQLPNSGTSQRLTATGIMSGAGALGGYGSDADYGTAVGALAGPAILGRGLLSRPAQKYLGNRKISGARDTPAAAAMRTLQAVRQGMEEEDQ